MKGSMTRTFDRSLEENGYYASVNAILYKHIWKALDSRLPEAEILHKLSPSKKGILHITT